MTHYTPEQMRALADDMTRLSTWHRQTTAALRAAADQLEAVERIASIYDSAGMRMVRAILNPPKEGQS